MYFAWENISKGLSILVWRGSNWDIPGNAQSLLWLCNLGITPGEACEARDWALIGCVQSKCLIDFIICLDLNICFADRSSGSIFSTKWYLNHKTFFIFSLIQLNLTYIVLVFHFVLEIPAVNSPYLRKHI